jgi:hypothetical protein
VIGTHAISAISGENPLRVGLAGGEVEIRISGTFENPSLIMK